MKRIKNTFSKSFFKASVIVGLFVMSLLLVPANANQTVHASPQDELKQLKTKIQETTNNLEAKKSEVSTLANEVASFDGQISQTEMKIQATEQEIAILKDQISQTENDLKTKKETLNEYMRVIYEESNTSTLELVAGSDSFSDFVDRTEYLQTMQLKIKEMVQKVKQLKEELENKKKDTEKLKDQLGSQRSDLNNKRSARASILEKTRGEEAEYQAILSESLKKQESLIASLSSGTGNAVMSGPVNTGDTIGYQGNTGFSTGSHLHFTIFQNNVAVDPEPLLSNGTFSWPEPVPPASITQRFGENFQYYSSACDCLLWAYGAGGHNGLDTAWNFGSPILAAGSGILYRGSNPGGYGNYAMIDHGNGYRTLYGHLQ